MIDSRMTSIILLKIILLFAVLCVFGRRIINGRMIESREIETSMTSILPGMMLRVLGGSILLLWVEFARGAQVRQ